MPRVADVHTIPIGGATDAGRGSPSNVFSSNILEMERGKKNSSNGGFFKWAAIIVAVLCLLFMLATIGLAIALGIKMNEHPDKPAETTTVTSQFGPTFPDPLNVHHNDASALGTGATGLSNHLDWPEPSGSLHATYKRAAVASDHGLCSEIGRDTLLAGGNAVDGMIASLLCIGVVNPQSSGLGGGFLMTLYNASTQRCISIDAREMAPRTANSTMFLNSPQDAVIGWRSIATPGELHGFWTVFNKFGSGRVAWKDLFTPAIALARNGFPVSSNLAMVFEQKEADIMADVNMKKAFTDRRTGRVYEEGDIIKRPNLADTLEEIASSADPVKLFYQGGMAQTIAAEIKEHGGYITTDDLKNYRTIVYDTPLETEALPGDLVMCGPPPPSSFSVTQAIVGVMSQFYNDNKATVNLDDPEVYHRLIEAEKFAYAYRTKLGDVNFVKDAQKISKNMTKTAFAHWIASRVPDVAQDLSYYDLDSTTVAEDHGTSHVVIIDREGNGISATSTVNQLLGSKRISPTLGILWNDEMDDFSTPGQTNSFGFAPSEANFIQPGKRPLSSMSPTVIYNKNDNEVKMVVGASGGSRIISAVAQTVIRTLLFNQTVKEAVDAPRFHNQFLPNVTEYESSAPKAIVNALTTQYHQSFSPVAKQASVVQALVVKEDGFIHGNSDFRRKTATYPAGY
uniref:Gamma-glutamyltranspeptidase 1 n=1 Tax=Panagrellus redivivus TaxID=6233 RepID=A0A7E4W5H0_PANRE